MKIPLKQYLVLLRHDKCGKTEAIQNSLVGRFQALGLHPTLSSALALAKGRNRG